MPAITSSAASRAGSPPIVEKAVSQWGLPNGYILGEEASGAFIGGLRYGEGRLYTKNAGDLRVFWQGPSLGFVRSCLRFAACTIKHHGQQRGATMGCRRLAPRFWPWSIHTLLADCLVTFSHFDDAIASKESRPRRSADLGEAWHCRPRG